MRIRHLQIKNFRGIKELDWVITTENVCLIGPGDSTKSTILEAIDLALTPKWNMPFADFDFYQGIITNPIEINLTITDLPQKLLQEDKYGLFITQWNKNDLEHDEEKDIDDKALILKLIVDGDLEPHWIVINRQTGDTKPISAADRELIGVAKIGGYIDRDLSWGRSSALSRLSGKDNVDGIPSLLSKITRDAVNAIGEANFDLLTESVNLVETAGKELGIVPKAKFRPGLDSSSINLSSGVLTLLDGNVPFKQGGLGSRRLIVMAINYSTQKNGSILLIDEIENGLEPFRLRNLIRTLRQRVETSGQCFSTTHSPIAIVEHSAEELFVVRSENGKTTINNIDNSLQNIIRGIPEAFLAKSVIVCEGKTEWGICRALNEYWKNTEEMSISCLGVEPIYSPKGGGSESPKYAVELRKIGYRILYFGDSDAKINPNEEEMNKLGIETIIWGDKFEVERRLCVDFPLPALEEFISLACEQNSVDSVWNKICEKLAIEKTEENRNLWKLVGEIDESELRILIGKAADEGSWYKRPDKGEKLGDLVVKYIADLEGKDSGKKIRMLKEWCYARD